MRELLAVIPYLDVIIIALLFFFIYIGWNNGTPRLLMVIGAVYTGFLLSAIYYHLFAVMLMNLFHIQDVFIAELISFLVLLVLVTTLMLALLLSLFGHIEIKNRLAVFDKLVGSVLGLLAGVLIIGIFLTILRVPYEAEQQKENAAFNMPIVQVFNQAYEKSVLSPFFLKGAPYFLTSIKPMLPPQVQAKGAVPLLQSIVAQSQNPSK
jgi:uncharacterized membrane protein required for colicin V production